MPKQNHELAVKQLRRHCDPKIFKFKTTKELPELKGVIGQERALRALTFGVNIQSHGYHIYVLGPAGTGKTTIIRKFLEQEATSKKVPSDWLYANNFDDIDKPHALELPAGKGREFKEDMDQFVEELKTEVPLAFESKEYANEQEQIEQEFQNRSKELFDELNEKAEQRGFKLLQTPQGFAAFPVIDGKVLTPEQEMELTENKRLEFEGSQEQLNGEMREILRIIEQEQKDGKEQIRKLDQRIIGFAIAHFIKSLKKKYAKYKNIVKLLTETRAALLKNVQAFKQIKQLEQANSQQKMMLGGGQEQMFEEYRVNVVVDNSKTTGVPVVFEKNPIGPNLVGRIEQQSWFGSLTTNFNMIKGGSLHRANGGYLIVEAMNLLTKPLAWHILKRALKNEEVVIESMGEAMGAFITKTLEPEPIPLKLKVVLIGDPYLYHMLYNMDPDFKELFKVKSDFEENMEWGKDNIGQYAQFISVVCNEEQLLHFDPTGVAKIIEHSSRLVTHQKKLATKFGDIVDLVRQASYWASQNGHKVVQHSDVQQALDEKTYRCSRIEQQIQELIDEGTILIDTQGTRVGQINGLAVMSLGDYSFGKPSRITARTYAGSAGVVNIDREIELGGPIHNKGTMIVAGYFGGKYATKAPLAFSATVAFEQLYGGVEGDSASAAEIYVLLSSLSDFPIKQDFAVTGSVNQHGELQPIGGANEKIEGFFQVCKLKGLTGTQGVLIPQQNIANLMLHADVVAAVKTGKFHIYAVTNVEEGIELLTGKSIKQIDTAVYKRLKFFAEAAEAVGKKKTAKKKATK